MLAKRALNIGLDKLGEILGIPNGAEITSMNFNALQGEVTFILSSAEPISLEDGTPVTVELEGFGFENVRRISVDTLLASKKKEQNVEIVVNVNGGNASNAEEVSKTITNILKKTNQLYAKNPLATQSIDSFDNILENAERNFGKR